jgi:hypothetical protein
MLDGATSSPRATFGSTSEFLANTGMFAGVLGPSVSGVTFAAAVWTLVFAGGSSLMRRNGATIASGNVGDSALGGLTLGGRFDSATSGVRFSGGVVGELACLQGVPSDRDDIESALMDRWGITP